MPSLPPLPTAGGRAATPDRWRFVHIPRTGGTSLAEAYGRGTDPRGHPHSPASAYPSRFALWTVVRNPFSRAVSIYTYLHRNGPATPAGFQHWAAAGFPVEGRLGTPAKDLVISDQQVNWLDAPCVAIVRHEYLSEDMQRICRWLGLPRQQIPHKNGFRKQPWTSYYNEAAAEQVACKYADDLALYARLRQPLNEP